MTYNLFSFSMYCKFPYGENQEWRSDGLKNSPKERREISRGGRARDAELDCTFCGAHVLGVFRDRESDASSPEWKFLCFSHSCSLTLQMAKLPFVQPPGISPNHNGITSEKTAGKSDFIIWRYGNICADRKKGGMRPMASQRCQPVFYYWTHTHTHAHVQMSWNKWQLLKNSSACHRNIKFGTLYIFLYLLL